jgi:hypothetical protein
MDGRTAMKAKKWEILTAVAAGAAIASAGWLGSGCAFVWMAAARADDVSTTTFACTKTGQTFEYSLPDATPETLTRLSVVQQGASGANCGAHAGDGMGWGGTSAVNGKVTITCPQSCPDGRNITYTFVMR